jgi:hypothetical protein
MTSIELTIVKINQKLISAFALLDSWLDRTELFRKTDNGGIVLDHIEHILFENQIFLKKIQEAVATANDLYNQGLYKPGRYTLAIDKAIFWEGFHPKVTSVSEDLKPSPETLRLLLRDQLYRCMMYLDQLSAGQGKLVDVTLPIDETIRLDLYQAMYFIALHTRRRINALTVVHSPMDACST